MTEPVLSPAAIEGFHQLIVHLPQTDDLPLIVLKGHLLIEERLVKLVHQRVRHVGAIDDANLRFRQLALVAKALTWNAKLEWIWSAIERLNTLRNQIAHNLEPHNIEHLVDRFLDYLDEPTVRAIAREQSVAARLRAGLAYTYGVLLGLLDPADDISAAT